MDRDLIMMMKSLLDKTSSWEEEEAAFTALLSSGVSLQSILSITPTTAAAAPHDDYHHHHNPMSSSSPSLMPLPFSQIQFAPDSLNTVHATANFDRTNPMSTPQTSILRLPKDEPISDYHPYFPTISTNTVSTTPFHHYHDDAYQFYENPPDLNLEVMMPTTPTITTLHLRHHDHHHTTNDPVSSMNDYSSIFHHLPDLLPLDHSSSSNYSYSVTYPSSSSYPFSSPSSPSYTKRPRFIDSPTTTTTTPQYFHPQLPPQPLPLFLPNHNIAAANPNANIASLAKAKTKKRVIRPSPLGSTLARGRRPSLSDKTRCLQKLLPSEKKMDNATVFEEVYKYVKFLQAQLTALHSMPLLTNPNTITNAASSSSISADHHGYGDDHDVHHGGLERLSRSQLLQVLLNSPVAQTVMYSQGCCVFSVEQLAKLNRTRSSGAPHLLHHYHPHLFFDSHSPTN